MRLIGYYTAAGSNSFKTGSSTTNQDNSFWESIDYSGAVPAVTAPVSLVAGWYDLFLPQQLADYVALRKAGRRCRLTVGPWSHVSLDGARAMLNEGIAWFDICLKDQPDRRSTSPVRILLRVL